MSLILSLFEHIHVFICAYLPALLSFRSYAKPPTIFLDDVLSALDGDTGSRVYDQLIGPEGYLCHSTRVLVTHAVNILPDADQVVVLKRGGALFAGPYATLQKEAEVLERAMSSMGPQESQGE